MKRVLLIALMAFLMMGCARSGVRIDPALLDRLDVLAAQREVAGQQEEADTIRAVSKAARSPEGADALTFVAVCEKLNLKGQATVIIGDSHFGPVSWNISGATAAVMLSINPQMANYELKLLQEAKTLGGDVGTSPSD